MRSLTLGRSGLLVTEIGFGVLTIGPAQLNLPLAEGAAVLRYALDRGIHFLDTAQYYRTYPYIRQALKGFSAPEKLVIVSKSLTHDGAAMTAAIEEARRELNRDVIEVFLLHEVRHDGDFEYRQAAWEALQEAKIKGLVKAVGVSTHHVDVAEQMAERSDVDVLFPLINHRSIGIRRASEPGTKEDMAAAIEKAAAGGIGVFAMKVLGGGVILNEYQEAISYARALPGVCSIMLGFGNTAEVDRIFELVEGSLTPDYQPDLSGKHLQVDQGDCEGCGLCVQRCPNHALFYNENGLAEVNPDLCMTCGYCAPVCPVRAIIIIG